MMKRITSSLGALGLILFITALSLVPVHQVIAANAPVTQLAAACTPGDGALPSALFVPWYAYLDGEGSGKDCKPVIGDDYVAAASKIGLAIIDTMTRLAGVLALGYVLYGAIQYVMSQGDHGGPGRPGPVVTAKDTIMNAVIGLVIALLAIGIVQFIGSLVRG